MVTLTVKHLERMNLPKRFWNPKLMLISEDGELSARQSVESYLKNAKKLTEDGAGLLFWGDNGKGKTSAACFILLHLRLKGLSCLFYESASLKADKINGVMFDDKSTVWERALTVDVLLLDDLGKGVQDQTGFGVRLLDELLRYRYARLKPTFVTTNMPPSQLKAELKPSTMSTLKEAILPIKVEGKDFREERKNDLLNIIKGGQNES